MSDGFRGWRVIEATAGRHHAQARRERQRSNADSRMTPGLPLFYRGPTRMSVISTLTGFGESRRGR